MKIAKSRVTAQGQISLPAEVRRRLGVGPGSVVEWEADGDVIALRRAGKFTSEDVHRALFDEAPTRHSLRDLREGIRRHVRARHARD